MISMLLHARDFCPPWITSYCWNGLTEDISQWFLSKLAVYLETNNLLFGILVWFTQHQLKLGQFHIFPKAPKCCRTHFYS